MASRAIATTAFLLMFNLVFFTLVTSTHTPKGCPPPPKPKQTPPPKPPTPSPKPPTTPPPKPPTPSPKPPTTPPPKPPTPSPKPPTTPPPKPPTPSPKPPTPACPPPPKTPAPSKPPPKATCPKDTLKLGVCATLLKDLLPIVIGTPPKTPCCSLLEGLVDLEAAVCLCTAIKANILGINLNVPISLSVLLNYCGKKVPSGFQCA